MRMTQMKIANQSTRLSWMWAVSSPDLCLLSANRSQRWKTNPDSSTKNSKVTEEAKHLLMMTTCYWTNWTLLRWTALVHSKKTMASQPRTAFSAVETYFQIANSSSGSWVEQVPSATITTHLASNPCLQPLDKTSWTKEDKMETSTEVWPWAATNIHKVYPKAREEMNLLRMAAATTPAITIVQQEAFSTNSALIRIRRSPAYSIKWNWTKICRRRWEIQQWVPITHRRAQGLTELGYLRRALRIWGREHLMLGGSKWCRILSKTLIRMKRVRILKQMTDRKIKEQQFSGHRFRIWKSHLVKQPVEQGYRASELSLCPVSFKNNERRCNITKPRWAIMQWWIQSNLPTSRRPATTFLPSSCRRSLKARRLQSQRDQVYRLTRCFQRQRRDLPRSSNTHTRCSNSSSKPPMEALSSRGSRMDNQETSGRHRTGRIFKHNHFPQVGLAAQLHKYRVRSPRSWAEKKDTISSKPQRLRKQAADNHYPRSHSIKTTLKLDSLPLKTNTKAPTINDAKINKMLNIKKIYLIKIMI